MNEENSYFLHYIYSGSDFLSDCMPTVLYFVLENSDLAIGQDSC
jgi:hypothetical protein